MRVLLIALLLLVARPARADDAETFRAATQRLGDGDLDGAQAAFDAMVEASPTGRWADDALVEGAEVAEKRGDLGGAQARWRALLDAYPTSPFVKRARLRLEALARAIGDDGAWLAVGEQYDAIQRAAVHAEDPTPQAEAMAALVAAHPDYPRAYDARMWIGDTYLRLALPAKAEAVYAEAEAGTQDPAQRWAAAKARADALAAQGRLDDAEHAYHALIGEGDLEDRAVRRELDTLRKLRARERLRVLCWLALGGCLLIVVGLLAWATRSAAKAARLLARPPPEAYYFAPVALVLAVVAWRGNAMVAGAVRAILLGGFVTTWLLGASLEACRRHRRIGAPLVLVHLALATIAIASVCYLAVFRDQLLDLIAETWHHGHDLH